jgi:diguanylate cyclase (GGDEF)-like protein
VQDATGRLLASTGKSATAGTNSCIADSVPLIHDGKPFGVLHYGVNTDFVETLKINFLTHLFIIAALWLFIGAAVYFFLVRRLVNPLREITRASESIAHGNLHATMPDNLPQDELGELATSFSNMATVLRERVESQQSYAQALYTEQARLNALISILPIGIMFVDSEHRVQYINQECRRLWGLSESDDYVGQRDSEIIALASNMADHPDAFRQHLNAVLKEYGNSPVFDTTLRSGQIVRSRSRVVPDAAGNRSIGRIWMYEDVSEEHARLLAAQSRSECDTLTGLYNRYRFEQDLERLFVQAQHSNRRLGLLHFGLDNFKNIKHSSGDKLLRAFAQSLSLLANSNETFYRLGGEEFAVLAVDATQQHIEALAQRIIAIVEQLKFVADEHVVHVRCSMGIATCSPDVHPNRAMELMRQADIALYQAKHLGKNRWHVFDPAHPLDLGKDSR